MKKFLLTIIAAFAVLQLYALAGSLNVPTGVAADSDGYVYVADRQNFAIHKYQPDGTQQGDVINGLSSAVNSIAVGQDKSVYYAVDYDNSKPPYSRYVWVARPDGGGYKIDPLTRAMPRPVAVAVDDGGNVYVADKMENAIQKFSKDGREETVANYLSTPISVAVDRNGIVYFLTSDDKKVWRATPQGSTYKVEDLSLAGLENPTAIAVDNAGNTLVTDTAVGGAIRKYSPQGNPLSIVAAGLGSPAALGVQNEKIYVISGNEVLKSDPKSDPDRESYYRVCAIQNRGLTGGLAVDSAQNIYATAGDRIYRYDACLNPLLPDITGGLEQVNHVAVDSDTGLVFFTRGDREVCKAKPVGGGRYDVIPIITDRLAKVTGIATDGDVYVTDTGNFGVRKYSSSGGGFVDVVTWSSGYDIRGNVVLEWVGGPTNATNVYFVKTLTWVDSATYSDVYKAIPSDQHAGPYTVREFTGDLDERNYRGTRIIASSAHWPFIYTLNPDTGTVFQYDLSGDGLHGWNVIRTDDPKASNIAVDSFGNIYELKNDGTVWKHFRMHPFADDIRRCSQATQ